MNILDKMNNERLAAIALVIVQCDKYAGRHSNWFETDDSISDLARSENLIKSGVFRRGPKFNSYFIDRCGVASDDHETLPQTPDEDDQTGEKLRGEHCVSVGGQNYTVGFHAWDEDVWCVYVKTGK